MKQGGTLYAVAMSDVDGGKALKIDCCMTLGRPSQGEGKSPAGSGT